jgi:hypothetical protein
MRTPRSLLVIAAATVLTALSFAQPSWGAKPKLRGPEIEIVSPAADSLARGKFVRFVVRARRGATITRALGERGNAIALKKRGHLRVAKLRRSKLDPGPEILVVEGTSARGQRLKSTVHFYVAGTKRPGLLRVSLAGTKSAGPLQTTARVTDRHAHLNVRLNGKAVDRLFGRHGTVRRASLSASDGLQYGTNTLSVVAFLSDGSYAVAKRRQKRARLAPLIGAGRDKSVFAGRGQRLNGRASLPVTPGDQLSYRWSVVRRPPGSKAHLRKPTTARPKFKPDLNGTYRFQLHVAEHPPGAGSGNTATSAADVAADTVTMTAQPDVGPLGVEVDTWDTTGPSPGITVGNQTVRDFPSGGGYLMLVLQRAGPQGGSLEIISTVSVPFGDEQLLASAIPSGSDASATMVIVTGTSGGPASPNANLNSALTSIGGTNASDVSDGFSIVGIPGQAQGQAWQYVQPTNAAASPFEGIEGRLGEDTSGDLATAGWVLTPTEYTHFSLGAGAEQMTIGPCASADDFCVTVPPPADPPTTGFIMAAVDAYSLKVRFPAEGYEAPVELEDLAGDLTAAANDPSLLVLLKSVGSPAPTTTSWFDLSQAIFLMGGNPQIFNDLNPPNQPGTADYGLVGGNGIAASEVWGQSEGSFPFGMTGVLTRSSDWRFGGALADQYNGERNYTLAEIAYEKGYSEPGAPDQHFPFSGDVSDPNDPYGQAEADIAQQIYCPPDPKRTTPCQPKRDIRSQYWLTTTNWDTSQLDDVVPKSGPYTRQQFNDLVGQLNTEWTMVNHVNQLKTVLLTPTVDTQNTPIVDVDSIVDAVKAAVSPPQGPDVVAEFLQVVEGVTAAAAAILAPEALAPIAAAAIGAAGGSITIIGAFTTDSEGNRLLQKLQTTADNLDVQLSDVISNTDVGYERLRELLVSDWNKLQDASGLYSGPLGSLSDTNALVTANHALALSVRRQAYETLFPAATTAKAPSDFSGPPSSLILQCVNGFSQASPTTVQPHIRPMVLAINGSLGEFTDETVTDTILASPAPWGANTNAGLDPDDFWVQAWPQVASGPCEPGL